MGQAATQRLPMTAVSGAALLVARWLPASLTAVDLPAITIGADEEERPACGSAAKTLAENGFRRPSHRRRGGLDSHGQLLARWSSLGMEAPVTGAAKTNPGCCYNRGYFSHWSNLA